MNILVVYLELGAEEGVHDALIGYDQFDTNIQVLQPNTILIYAHHLLLK